MIDENKVIEKLQNIIADEELSAKALDEEPNKNKIFYCKQFIEMLKQEADKQ